MCIGDMNASVGSLLLGLRRVVPMGMQGCRRRCRRSYLGAPLPPEALQLSSTSALASHAVMHGLKLPVLPELWPSCGTLQCQNTQRYPACPLGPPLLVPAVLLFLPQCQVCGLSQTYRGALSGALRQHRRRRTCPHPCCVRGTARAVRGRGAVCACALVAQRPFVGGAGP